MTTTFGKATASYEERRANMDYIGIMPFT